MRDRNTSCNPLWMRESITSLQHQSLQLRRGVGELGGGGGGGGEAGVKGRIKERGHETQGVQKQLKPVRPS